MWVFYDLTSDSDLQMLSDGIPDPQIFAVSVSSVFAVYSGSSLANSLGAIETKNSSLGY